MNEQNILPLGPEVEAEVRQILLDKLIAQAVTLLPDISTGPWIADTKDHAGNNWLLASFGASLEDDAQWILTTDHVRASELSGDAKADAQFCALARQLMPLLIDEIRELRKQERNPEVAHGATNRL